MPAVGLCDSILGRTSRLAGLDGGRPARHLPKLPAPALADASFHPLAGARRVTWQT